jgi:hypothetical protein
VVWCSWSGQPISVKPAGGFSVSHMASMAASFIFWVSPMV